MIFGAVLRVAMLVLVVLVVVLVVMVAGQQKECKLQEK